MIFAVIVTLPTKIDNFFFIFYDQAQSIGIISHGNIRKDMIPKGDLPGICEDCGEHIMYSKNNGQTHAEILKKHRCPNCGNFALKTKSLDI